MKHALLAGLVIPALIAHPAYAKGERASLVAKVEYADCAHQVKQSALGGALLSLVLAPVIEAGIKGLGNALASAGEPKKAHVVASASDSFFKTTAATTEGLPVDTKFNCLQLAAGVPGGDSDVAISADNPQDTAIFGSGIGFLEKSGFAKRPSIYLQSIVVFAPDRSAWRLVPTHLYIGSPLTTAKEAAKRDLVVTLTVYGVAAKADEGVIASRSIVLRGAQNGYKKANLDGIPGLETSWMPLPPLSDAVKALAADTVQRRKDIEALQIAKVGYLEEAAAAVGKPVVQAAARAKAKKADEDIVKLDDRGKKDTTALQYLAPVTFTFDVHETADGNKFLAGLGKALAGKSAELAAPIAAAIDPAKRTEAAIAKGDKEDALRIAAINAIAAWKASVDDKESAAKQSVAKIGAKGACRTLELRGFYDAACLEVS